MLRSFAEVYPFLCGVFLTTGIIYILSFNWKKANRAYFLFGLISLFAGFWFGFVRQIEGDGSYSTYTKIFALSYSIFTLLLPWFIGYYGPLWKPKWLWFISFLMISKSIIYRIGPEIYPTPWLYFGVPAFVATFIYGIASARILLKQGFLRKGILFLISNAGSLLFVIIHSISEFFGNPMGIKYPESLFLIDGFIIFFLFLMTFELLFDIKSKSSAEQKLAHQMERWQQTLDEVELVIVELDFKGIVKYVNPYFSALTGFRSKEIIGENWFEKCVPEDVIDNLTKAHQDNINDERSYFFQNPILTSKGDERIIYWSNVMLKDDVGAPSGSLSIGTDVTNREKTFQDIEKLKRSLEEENIKLKEGFLERNSSSEIQEGTVIDHAIQKVKEVTRYQELDQLKSQFFANVSHEFRTPLTLILNPIKSIIAKNKDQKLNKELNLVERNASKLLKMVNQLLDLSKLEAGKMDDSKKIGDLLKTTRVISASFDSLATSRGVTFTSFFPLAGLVTEFNEDHIEKILNNVLSNALKFTEEHGKVTLVLKVLNESQEELLDDKITSSSIKYVRMMVRDTGIGIEPEKLPHIFDRFYQAESSSTTKYEGTGIGLALVKDLVELHKGNVEVKSEPGWGTEVAIVLPVHKVYEIIKEGETTIGTSETAFVETDPNTYEETTTPESELPDNSNVVQIVEDNQDLREHIRGILAPDYRVIETKDGEEGLNSAIEQIPDLIISDVMMPRMDGMELANKLKEDHRTSHIPVILLTAKSSHDDKLAGLKLGADEYLAKPFDEEELKIRIENLIQIRSKLQQQYAYGLPQSSTEKPDRETVFISRATEVVINNIENDQFTVEDLSGELGMSRVQFHRKIKALTDQSTTTFIRNIRLEKAKQLLVKGDYNVTEVAYMVGFSSQSYFTKSFQKHFGKAPSAFQG